jgi:hypothetical protein
MIKILQLGFLIGSVSGAMAQTSPPAEDFQAVASPYYKFVTDTINFDPYASGTEIIDQYFEEGAQFSGVGTTAPQVYDYGIGSWGKVLISPTWFDPIRIDFVDTITGLSTQLVQKIELLNPIDSEVDYIKIDIYDASDNLLQSYTSASPEEVSIDLGSPLAAYMILDDDQGTAYVVDNILLDFGDASANVSETTDEAVNIFPNPAIDVIKIVVPKTLLSSKYEIIDQLGRIVLNGQFNQEATELNITSLEKGIYSVKSYTGTIAKLIKK